MKFSAAGEQVATCFFGPFLAPRARGRLTCGQPLITHLKAACTARGEDASTSVVYLEARQAVVGVCHRTPAGAGRWEWAHTSLAEV